MKKENLQSKTRKKHKATTNSKHTMPVAQNILNQQFNADKPQSVLVSDITYIPTSKGWVYLASVMDLYSRKIIGWAADKQMAKELTLLALTRAYNYRQPKWELLRQCLYRVFSQCTKRRTHLFIQVQNT